MQCGLCGHVFAAENGQCTPACPMARGCTMVCCPNCGYGMPDESRGTIVRLGRKLISAVRDGGWRGVPWNRDREGVDPPNGQQSPEHLPGAAGPLPLNRLPAGHEGSVVRIGTSDIRRLESLSDLGIVPGGTLRVLQKGSTSVVRVDETEVALDSAIARDIYIQL